ncbi:hypothetical protein [Kitasatospora griseola]|uniref:hypothetical protein n=1 Tax=Kitasatospora griseola TaxID=2064 RepID=UPI003426A49B
MLKSRWRSCTGQIDDRELAAFLAGEALMEIRILARRPTPQDVPSGETVDRIKELATFSHEMLAVSRTVRRRPSGRPPTRREQAMADRPMCYPWHTSSPERRAWILDRIDRFGLRWTPPPPIPVTRKGVQDSGRGLGFLVGWPVKTPAGRRPLPRSARVLKALDGEALIALRGEDEYGGWLRAHLAPGATHFLLPDPADHAWPAGGAGRWRCRLLLRMADEEQVTGWAEVRTEDFVALPSNVPRPRQRRLARIACLTERDTYLWAEDHRAEAKRQDCGCEPADSAPA